MRWHTTAVGVRLALMIYASLISFLCDAELLNCLWMLAKRCCGLEAILMDVRSADDDIASTRRSATLKVVNRRKRWLWRVERRLSHGGYFPQLICGARELDNTKCGVKPRCLRRPRALSRRCLPLWVGQLSHHHDASRLPSLLSSDIAIQRSSI
jgi:hypothetical protein